MKKIQYDLEHTDVLIIGGGGAAAIAALSAAKSGVTVAIVSKETSFVGGATVQAAGGISCVVDPQDSPQIFYEDTIRAGGQLNNASLVKVLAERSLPSLLKLSEYHYSLDMDTKKKFHRINHGEGHTFPRLYMDRRESVGMCHALGRMLGMKGIRFYPEVIIEKLLLNENQVVGSIGFDIVSGQYRAIIAKATILATGGLGQLYEITTNARTLTGDGFDLAWQAGAELVDLEMVQYLPLAFPYPQTWRGTHIGTCSLWGPKLKLLNGRRERYMEKYDPDRMEYSTRDNVSRANYSEIKKGQGTEADAVIVDPTENDKGLLQVYKNSVPFIYARVAKIFGAEAAQWATPFEAIPSQHFFMGGVMIDAECRTNLPGLFAVGEVAGGVHGSNRLAGNALCELLVFGDIAGSQAAKWAKRTRRVQPNQSDVKEYIMKAESLFEQYAGGLNPGKIKEQIKTIMWQFAGPVRNEKGLKKAITKLKDLQKYAVPKISLRSDNRRYNLERVERGEVSSMLRIALLIAQAARLRKESRGSHFMEDYPIADDFNWLKNIVLAKDGNGEMVVSYRRVAGF